MGVEFHITRAEFWAENEGQQITSNEWLDLVNADSELTLDKKNGEFYVVWHGQSAYEEPWLEWSDGNIYTKWPDTHLYRKMLQIAAALNARVMDDDGTIYSGPNDWEYVPGH
jgi:hypothetical protein